MRRHCPLLSHHDEMSQTNSAEVFEANQSRVHELLSKKQDSRKFVVLRIKVYHVTKFPRHTTDRTTNVRRKVDGCNDFANFYHRTNSSHSLPKVRIIKTASHRHSKYLIEAGMNQLQEEVEVLKIIYYHNLGIILAPTRSMVIAVLAQLSGRFSSEYESFSISHPV